MTNASLTQRRAEFVYEACRLAAIAANAPIIPVPLREREQAFKDQFNAVIERQCGPQRSYSPEELHGSWMQPYYSMGWVYGEKYDREKKVHPDLVPYAQLGQLEKDKDAVFIAICDIAREWIYDILDDAPLSKALAALRAIPTEWDDDSYRELGVIRHGPESPANPVTANPLGWKDIETRPVDTPCLVLLGNGRSFIAEFRDHAAFGDYLDSVGAWVAIDETYTPPSWTDGMCWGKNEDGVPSEQPIAWRPLMMSDVIAQNKQSEKPNGDAKI